MKIPLTWLKDYVDTNKSPAEIADSFTRIGLMLDKPVGDDNVLDLEQRLNRADLLSIVGCARDFAAFENIKLKEPKRYNKPGKKPEAKDKIKITVTTPAVRRFNTRVFRGIKVGPSPAWLRERLEAYGMESKNNIVDITNYVMVEYGQTLHAQDIAKLPAPEITARQAQKGETVTTLLGTTVTLDSDAFVLSSGGKPVVIGGIVGGIETGVTDKTTDILLDAGNYNQTLIRKVSRKLKIFNESVQRNDKFLNPKLTEIALARATELILELAGGTYYENDDYYPHPTPPQSLRLTYARLALISGISIEKKEVKAILQKLGYVITGEDEKGVTVESPYYRTDLEVEDDLISDILRMRDYNTIIAKPLATPIPSEITPAIYRFEDRLRDSMVAIGAHEHITNPLLSGDDNPDRVVLENALSEDASALRMNLLESLRPVAESYGKHGLMKTPIFELGLAYEKKNKKYKEHRQLAVISNEQIGVILATLLHNLGVVDYDLTANKNATNIIIKNDVVGSKYRDAFVVDTTKLMECSAPYPPITYEYTYLPSLDLSVSLPPGAHFADVSKIIKSSSPKPASVAVVEHYKDSLLVRLTWNDAIDADKVRKELVSALKDLGLETRSE